MRDIRQDLRDRIEEIAVERQRLDQLERSLRDLLKAEERRWASTQQKALPLSSGTSKPRRKPHAEMSDKTKFLLETLADRRPWPIDLLVEAAKEKGVQFGGKHPRRVLHFVLLGMMQRGIVEKSGDSDWRMIISERRGNDAGVLIDETPASLQS